MRSKDALRKIAEAFSRKRNAAAVVVPRKIAFALVEEVYPDDDACDLFCTTTERARAKYIDLVSKGGYIGTLMRMPMIVADDVVICSLNEQELRESAPRLGVDLAELHRDHARSGAV